MVEHGILRVGVIQGIPDDFEEDGTRKNPRYIAVATDPKVIPLIPYLPVLPLSESRFNGKPFVMVDL
jgi:hypothetical protein